MDTLMLLSKIPETKNRVNLISGSGIYFINREVYKSSLDNYIIQLLTDFNGSNIDEVLSNAMEKGILLSIHPKPKKWNLGILSEYEIETTKELVGDNIFDKRLIDIQDGGKVLLGDNSNQGSTEIINVPKGTIFINCGTKNIFTNSMNKKDVLSKNNLILSPREGLLGNPYDCCHLLTHYWYLGYFNDNAMIKYYEEFSLGIKDKEFLLTMLNRILLNRIYLPYPRLFPLCEHIEKKYDLFKTNGKFPSNTKNRINIRHLKKTYEYMNTK